MNKTTILLIIYLKEKNNNKSMVKKKQWKTFLTILHNKTLHLRNSAQYLGFFQLLVVVSLQFDQRTKDILVLVGVFVAQQHMLRFLIHTGLF